jgi:hypothetical protein
MYHTNKYHDEHYDGIVLRLDRGFMMTNPELEVAVKEFQNALNACRCSTMMPDHGRNLNELSNWHEKSDRIKAKKNKREDDEREYKADLQAKLKGDYIEISYDKYTINSFNERDHITIDNIYYENIFTRSGIKSPVKRAYNKFIQSATHEEFIEFLKYNNFIMFNHEPKDLMDITRTQLTKDSYDCMNITILIPYIKKYSKGKRDKSQTFVSKTMLYYHNTLGYFIIHTELHDMKGVKWDIGGETTNKLSLTNNGYKLNGQCTKLIK